MVLAGAVLAGAVLAGAGWPPPGPLAGVAGVAGSSASARRRPVNRR